MARKVEITESAYIIISDLTKIRSIRSILRDLIPAANDKIDLEEYRKVQTILAKWESKLANSFVSIGE